MVGTPLFFLLENSVSNIKRLYKCSLPSMNYVTVKGRNCAFIEGRFITDHPDEISELDQMVNDKSSPHIYIDENEREVDIGLQERIKAAQKAATLAVLEEAAKEKQGQQDGKQEDQGQQKEPTAIASLGKTMSPASLMGITSTASLGGLASLSNAK